MDMKKVIPMMALLLLALAINPAHATVWGAPVDTSMQTTAYIAQPTYLTADQTSQWYVSVSPGLFHYIGPNTGEYCPYIPDFTALVNKDSIAMS